MKRFWKAAAVAEGADGFAVELDGRPVKTPKGNPLTLPARALAEAMAGEWDAQGEDVDPATMPLTKLAQGAIDEVSGNRDHYIGRIAAYADGDMLCYRADDMQAELAAEQAREWDPLLDWARARYDVSFEPISGIMHRAQPPATLARLQEAVAAQDDFTLAGMLDLVGLGGSLVLVLALVEGQYEAQALWDLSLLEEYWQERQWGSDEEAMTRREQRYGEWSNAARFVALSRS